MMDEFEPLIAGWFTPDYAEHYENLLRSIVFRNFDHDFQQIQPLIGSWEARTREKPWQMMSAIYRNPDRTLLYLDVDCHLMGSREAIIDLCRITGDIAFHITAKARKSGVRMHPYSGTMVLNPTKATLEFLMRWAQMDAKSLATDEVTMGLALKESPGLTITLLPETAVASLKTKDPLILHPERTGRRASKLTKLCRGVWPF